MQNQSQNKMAVQPIPSLMFQIGLPIVLSMILQAAYNVVDSAYLARMASGGEDALTALSLAFPVQLFMVAVSIVWWPLAVGEMVTLCVALVLFFRARKTKIATI